MFFYSTPQFAGPRVAAWRFDPSAAAKASARISAAVALGQGVALPVAERRALFTSMSLNVTALRNCLPAPALPLMVVDSEAKRIADEQGGVIDPASGKSAVIVDAFGPVVGRSDERVRSVILAGARACRLLASMKETSAPVIDLGGGYIGTDGDPIVVDPGAEKLGIAPAVVVGIAAGALIVGAVTGWFISSSRAAMDAAAAVEINDANIALKLERERMELEAKTGKPITPSPLVLGAAERIKDGAKIESTSRLTVFGIGAGVGVAALLAIHYGAPRYVARKVMGG